MEWLHFLTIAGTTLISVGILHKENEKTLKQINKEMRDFHGRLCALEEKYTQMMERISKKK